MVNPGRPSAACLTCKEGRVKCDQQKPRCRRCVRLKIACAGYPDPWDILHRQQDARTAATVRSRVEKSLQRRQTHLVPIPRPVQLPVELYTVNRLYHDYTVGSNIAFSHLASDLYQRQPHDCFTKAVEATALASASRQLRRADLMERAIRSYGRAVSGLSREIPSPASIGDDSILATLFVLGLFETTAADLSPAASQPAEPGCHPHARGAFALLRCRAEQQLATTLDRNLLILFRHIRLMDLFASQQVPSLWYELDAFCATAPGSPSLEPVVRQATDFRIAAILTKSASPPLASLTASAHELVVHGLDIARRLEATAAMVSCGSDAQPHLTAFNEFVSVSGDNTVAIAMSLYLTVRLHVIEQILELSKVCLPRILVESPDDTAYSSWASSAAAALQDQIRVVLDPDGSSTSSEAPAGMGFRAFALFWPMMALLKSPITPDETKSWTREKLREIGNSSGFGLATTAIAT